jgi:hypothetical protein
MITILKSLKGIAMSLKTVAIVLSLLAFTACTSTEPKIETGADAEVIMGNLHRVDNSRVGLAYVDPEADFSKYSKILLQPLDVSDVQIVQPSRSASNRKNDWVLTVQDQQNLQKHYQEVFTRELQETGDYEIVDKPGPDVLSLTGSLTGIAPSAAKDDNRSRAVGRTRVYTEGSGAMSIAFGFADAETGEVLAIVKDTRSGSPMWGSNNSVSNMSDVRFMFGNWARQIRARLDIVHGY